jgi:hypothetical protein
MKSIYSLLLLFLGLWLTELANAQSGATLLVRTGMSCEWQLDGRPMGLLKGGDVKEITVSIGSHIIYSASRDGLAAARIEVEVDHGPKTIFITPQSQTDLQSKEQLVDEGGKRALADTAKTWTDPSTGLMWTKKDNGLDVSWNQATAYCSNLHLASFSDWRLPSIDELQDI